MRRLPVYLLLDTSGSMTGDPIDSVREGVDALITALRKDPYALETAYISVITFANEAKQIVPLTDLPSFQMPEIRASGLTALGDALALVSACADREVMLTSASTKGDWKPLVFILTDGGPNDFWEPDEKRGFIDTTFMQGLKVFKAHKWGTVVACAVGLRASTKTLRKVTDNIVKIFLAEPDQFKAFFKWVSASVSASILAEPGETEANLEDLPPPPPEVEPIAPSEEEV